MNQLVTAAARRRVVEIERRIAHQRTMVERLIAADDDAREATRTLRTLQQTLALYREHLCSLRWEDWNNAAPGSLSSEQSVRPT